MKALFSKRLAIAFAMMLIVAAVAAAFEQPTVRSALVAEKERQAAPAFALEDASGQTAQLKDYQGKILLIDFWATWCTGCKMEIPWFSEFQKTYGSSGLAVVGVSLDGEGWKVVKPFLAKTHVPYRMVLGDDATAKQFGIETMPDTFLIDRKGRLAAAYRAGLVDREDMEKNIKALLAEK